MEDLYEKIELYLSGGLNGQEKETFEADIQRDSSLANEVALYRQVRETVSRRANLEKEEADFLNLLNEGKNEDKRGIIRDFRRRNLLIVAIAAGVALILASIILLRKVEKSGPELFAMYVEAPTLPNLRDTEGGVCEEGAVQLKEGQYADAINSLEQCLGDSSKGLDVSLALAYAYLYVDDAKAKELLEEIDRKRHDFLPTVKYKAVWYLILLGVKLEDWENVNAMLNDLLQLKDLPLALRKDAEVLKSELPKN
ncbi:MAG: tetratricopeptide repeat protein [Bacteroidia bacterium]|nr:tetratricopeptide repeat protein [Bacteroidia bacterium]